MCHAGSAGWAWRVHGGHSRQRPHELCPPCVLPCRLHVMRMSAKAAPLAPPSGQVVSSPLALWAAA